MIDLSKYQDINRAKALYDSLYKKLSTHNIRYLQYGLFRISGLPRNKAYVAAGYKPQGKSKSGKGDLDSTNAIHFEKRWPYILDFIHIGKHLNYLKMYEQKKTEILTPEQRMQFLSDIAKGEIQDVVKIKEYKLIESVRFRRQQTKAAVRNEDGNIVHAAEYKDVAYNVKELKPIQHMTLADANLKQRTDAIDKMNKMDGTYKQEIVLTKSSDDALREMTDQELAEKIAQISQVIKIK